MTLTATVRLRLFCRAEYNYALATAANLLEQFVIAESPSALESPAGVIDPRLQLRLGRDPSPADRRRRLLWGIGRKAAPHLRQNLAVVILIAWPLLSHK